MKKIFKVAITCIILGIFMTLFGAIEGSANYVKNIVIDKISFTSQEIETLFDSNDNISFEGMFHDGKKIVQKQTTLEEINEIKVEVRDVPRLEITTTDNTSVSIFSNVNIEVLHDNDEIIIHNYEVEVDQINIEVPNYLLDDLEFDIFNTNVYIDGVKSQNLSIKAYDCEFEMINMENDEVDVKITNTKLNSTNSIFNDCEIDFFDSSINLNLPAIHEYTIENQCIDTEVSINQERFESLSYGNGNRKIKIDGNDSIINIKGEN